MFRFRRLLVSVVALCLMLPSAFATWSIVLVNLETGEVAVGCATCITGMDLSRVVPAIIPEVGAAAAQSFIDGGAVNRARIRDAMLSGRDLQAIVDELKDRDQWHQARQYGMVDMQGRALSFSGRNTLRWAGGATGQVGNIVYAIQGNVLTGAPVVDEAEQAVLNTPGDLAEKLMAAMEAAYAMGGDGRCSCTTGSPTSCGSPPQSFTKSAHVGFMIIARPGDELGDCTGGRGCATADYYMKLNVAGTVAGDPDPVLTLRQDYDVWRLNQRGRPDGSRSLVFLSQGAVPAGSAQAVEVVLDLRDIDGAALGLGGHTVTVTHDTTSAGQATVQSIVDHQDGTYTITLTPGSEPGVDRYRIVVDDGIHPATMWPLPTLVHQPGERLPLNDLKPIPGIDTPALERQCFLLDDGLEAWFLTNRQGKGRKLVRARRSDLQSDFGAPQVVLGLNGPKADYTDLWVSEDKLHVVLSGYEPGATVESLFASTRASTSEAFSDPSPIDSLNSGRGDGGAWLSPDRTRIVFHSRRMGGTGGRDLWTAERYDADSDWFAPHPLAALNTVGEESSPLWTDNGTRLLFSRAETGEREALCIAELQADLQFGDDRFFPGAVHRAKRMAFTAMSSDGSLAWIGRGLNGGLGDALQAIGRPDSLQSLGGSISAAQGGQIDFQLDAGPGWAGASYALIVSGQGVGPQARLLDAILPLQVDAVTQLTRQWANQAPLFDFVGQLDSQGQATARLQLQPNSGLKAGFLNRRYRVAFAARLAQRAFASNAVQFELLP